MDRDLHQSVLKLLCTRVRAEEATYWAPVPDGLSLRAVLNEGPHAEQVEGFEVPVASSLVGWAWASGQGLCVGPEAPYHPGLATRTDVPTRGMMASPVAWEGEPVGVISVINPANKPRFDMQDLERLEHWCEWLGQPRAQLETNSESGPAVPWFADLLTAAQLTELWIEGRGDAHSNPEAGFSKLGSGQRVGFLPGDVAAQERLRPFFPILERRVEGDSTMAATQAEVEEAPTEFRVEALISQGEFLKAADLASEGLATKPSRRLQHLRVLALARGRSFEAAQDNLESLAQEGLPDSEILGLLARLAKDRWDLAGAEPNSPLLEAAIERYETAFALQPGHWPSINAATLCRVARQQVRADQWLAAAQEDAGKTLAANPGDVWAHASLGEAALHLGDDTAARGHFKNAFPPSPGANLGSRSSARRNGRMLLRALGRPESELDGLLPPPRLAVFAGHLMDAEHRQPERFPERLVPAVRAALEAWVEEHQPEHVLAGAACGSDLLLLEVLAERGIPFTVVLPCECESFLASSVDKAWEALFHRLLAQAEAVHSLNEGSNAKEEGVLSFAAQVLLGLALWKTSDLGGHLEAFGVWDPGSVAKPGGTEEFLARAQATGVGCTFLDLRELRRTGIVRVSALDRALALPYQEGPENQHKVRPFLFGDLAGFSAFRQPQVEAFVQHGLGLVGGLREHYNPSITVASTWGDGLFVVFETMRAALGFTTDLMEAWAAEDWAARGLPERTAWRLSLHAGPLTSAMDPVAQLPSVFGKPLVRAARMEPITPINAIYVSLEFAALMMLEDCSGFALDYAGEVSLPKKAGKFPMFRLRRTRGRNT